MRLKTVLFLQGSTLYDPEAVRARLSAHAKILKLELATKKKTLAQQLIEADESEEQELFSILNDELRAPTWMTPLLEQFPTIPKPQPQALPQLKVSFTPSHSRSSSTDSLSAL